MISATQASPLVFPLISGKNTEYLLNLAVAMKKLVPEAEDDHLYGLEKMVRERIGE